MKRIVFLLAAGVTLAFSGCAARETSGPTGQPMVAPADAYRLYLERQEAAAAKIVEIVKLGPDAANAAVLAVSPAAPIDSVQPFGNLAVFSVSGTCSSACAASEPGAETAATAPAPAAEEVKPKVETWPGPAAPEKDPRKPEDVKRK